MPDRHLSEKEIEEMCIGLNLHQGSFDYEVLANEWDMLDLLEYGFTEDNLVGIYDDVEKVATEEKEKNSSKKMKSCPNCGHEF